MAPINEYCNIESPSIGYKKENVTAQREINGWCMYDFANGPFFGVAIAYIPLVVTQQIKAVAKSQFCGPCFHNEWAVHYETEGQCDNAKYTTNSSCVEHGSYWEAEMKNEAKYVDILGSSIGYVSFPQYCFFAAIVVQVLMMFTFGSLADYSSYRKTLLMISTWVPTIALVVIPLSDIYWVTGLLYIVSVVGFYLAFVPYNSYLPVLVSNTRQVMADPETSENTTEKISLKGFGVGLVGRTIFLIFNFIIALKINEDIRIPIVAAGVWAFAFSAISFYLLKPRPGPPLTENFCKRGIAGCRKTFKSFRELTEMRKFLIAHFFMSDGCTAIGQSTVLFAKDEMNMTSSELGIILIEGMALGVLGCVVFHYFNSWCTAKTILLINLGFMMVVPLYLFVLSNTTEVYILAALFGLNVGSWMSFSRSIYSHMIPKGKEAEYFSIFIAAEKGISPIVMGLIYQYTGSYRYTMGSLAGFIIIGFIIILFVDVPNAQKQKIDFHNKHNIN